LFDDDKSLGKESEGHLSAGGAAAGATVGADAGGGAGSVNGAAEEEDEEAAPKRLNRTAFFGCLNARRYKQNIRITSPPLTAVCGCLK